MAVAPLHPRWWFRHKLLALLALLFLTLLLRLAWGWWVGADLQRRLAQIRARNHPMLTSDVVYSRIPESQNAWSLQVQASRALAPNIISPSNSPDSPEGYPRLDARWKQLAEASEKAHAPAFALARQARQRNGVLIRSSLPSPIISTTLPYLGDIMELSRTICDGAIHSHLQGNDDEAIERILDVLHIARSVRHDDFLVCQQVAFGIEVRAVVALRIIISDSQHPSRPTTRPASPDKLRRLIAHLLDESTAQNGVRRAAAIERVIWIDYYTGRAAKYWAIRPLAQRDLIRALDNTELLVQASHCASAEEAREVLKRYRPERPAVETNLMWPRPTRKTEVPRYSRWLSMGSSSYRDLERYFRIFGDRRAAAIALAAHLYRLDRGRWPAQLSDLVPLYLPSIPADPFHSDNRPIGYLLATLPDGSARPLLYFDAGRTDVPIPDKPTYEWHSDQRPGQVSSDVRQYRDITWFDPALLKKAVDGQPRQPDAPGNDPQKYNQAK